MKVREVWGNFCHFSKKSYRLDRKDGDRTTATGAVGGYCENIAFPNRRAGGSHILPCIHGK